MQARGLHCVGSEFKRLPCEEVVAQRWEGRSVSAQHLACLTVMLATQPSSIGRHVIGHCGIGRVSVKAIILIWLYELISKNLLNLSFMINN